MKYYSIYAVVIYLITCYTVKATQENALIEQKVFSINAKVVNHPVLIGETDVNVLNLDIKTNTLNFPEVLEKVTLFFGSDEGLNNIGIAQLIFSETVMGSSRHELISSVDKLTSSTEFKCEKKLSLGTNIFKIAFTALTNAKLSESIQVTKITVSFSDGSTENVVFPGLGGIIRFGYVLRAAGEDNCNTFRIPGLATTNKGTLISVFDNRYNNSNDLQGNIDIGMRRSTDGGQTWAPMKVIMDMGEWGGKPQSENGIGDPCILVDALTNTIWVAALWIHGFPEGATWNTSKPGMQPDETGQFILVKSEDDGITWSEPINITKQVKNPSWYLLLQGPGKGITLSDGTLIFPVQYKDHNQVPYSTVIFSKDHGKSWEIGLGAKSNTTEAQVVQLSSGEIMLNMRDDRNRTEKGANNGRAIATSSDLGKTWKIHPTSNSILPEPNCMASIISANLNLNGKMKLVLFFSNPNNKFSRTNMTIKASIDQGMTWPLEFQVEINQNLGYGYSCLTMVDNQYIGILYEGVKSLIFQKIPVSTILKGLIK